MNENDQQKYYKLPLIQNYIPSERTYQDPYLNSNTGIFSKITHQLQTFTCSVSESMKTNLYGFGSRKEMCGKKEIDVTQLRDGTIHNLYRSFWETNTISGSHVVRLPSLNYLHFILDIDLKRYSTLESSRLSTAEYREYLTHRQTTLLPSPSSSIVVEDSTNGNLYYNTNNVIYELVYHIVEYLGLDWLPIYILGKSQTFTRGFHLEIPQLSLSYYDFVLMSNSCQQILPTLVDITTNYSIFGSQKSPLQSSSLISNNEMDCTYLPYAFFYKNSIYDMVNLPPSSLQSFILSNINEVFDIFNICKHHETNSIIGFPTVIGMDEDTLAIYNFRHKLINFIQNKENIDNSEDDDDFKIDDEEEEDEAGKEYDMKEKELILSNTNYIINKIMVGFFFIKLKKTHKLSIYKSLHLPAPSSIHQPKQKHQQLLFALERYSESYIYIREIPHYLIFNDFNQNCCDDNDDADDYSKIRMTACRIEKLFTTQPLRPKSIHGKTNNIIMGSDAFLKKLHPFSIKHIICLCKQSTQHLHTVSYLLALLFVFKKTHQNNVGTTTFTDYNYFIARVVENLNDHQMDTEPLYEIIYLLLRYQAKEQVKEELEDWIILSLLNLLIVSDIVTMKEAFNLVESINPHRLALVEQMNVDELDSDTYRIVPSANSSRPTKIPRIIIAFSILQNFGTTEYNNFLAIFKPIICDKNSRQIQIWENSSMKWTNQINTAFLVPDIAHLSRQIIYIENLIQQQQQQAEKETSLSSQLLLLSATSSSQTVPPPPPLSPSESISTSTCSNSTTSISQIITPQPKSTKKSPQPKSTKKSKHYHNSNTNYSKKNLTQTTLLNSIKSFYANIQILDIPRYFIAFPQCYIISGGSYNKNSIFYILPLPLYKSSNQSSDTRPAAYDSKEVLKLIDHLPHCTFFMEQFNPIIKEIIHYENEQRKYYKKLTVEERQKNNLLNREQYHVDFTDRLWHNGMNRLAQIVKYYVLRNMVISPELLNILMENVNIEKEHLDLLNSLIVDCRRGKKLRQSSINERIHYLDIILKENIKVNGRGIRKDNVGEPIAPTCNCQIVEILLTLTQIFSYDAATMICFFSLIVRACHRQNEKKITICIGESNSGKTALLNILTLTLGDLTGILSVHTAHKGLQERTHDLGRGGKMVRMWYMDELSTTKTLNSLFLKQLSGNAPIWIRQNYMTGDTYNLATPIFLFGNNCPTFSEYDSALMQRLRFISFRARFDSEIPTSFQYSIFPQFSLMTDDRRKKRLTEGMMTLFVHANCHDKLNSPWFVSMNQTTNFIPLPINIMEATEFYSPARWIVAQIMEECHLTEKICGGFITVYRLAILLHSFPKALKNISMADAHKFIENIYKLSWLSTNSRRLCDIPDSHYMRNEPTVSIIEGICEQNPEFNDRLISRINQI
ncbi:putative helicase [Astathelohania contejeani]|uniref:Helicase n=1 Tax=Astathelohania contejeani TaxID=164912 RepID=A0ABQ7HWF7_9MICR|nr:putative helicase [Thelohania contejeani]